MRSASRRLYRYRSLCMGRHQEPLPVANTVTSLRLSLSTGITRAALNFTLVVYRRRIFSCRRAEVECDAAEHCRASCSFFSVVQDEPLQDKPLSTSGPCPRFWSPTTRLPRICHEALARGMSVRPLRIRELAGERPVPLREPAQLSCFCHPSSRRAPVARPIVQTLSHSFKPGNGRGTDRTGSYQKRFRGHGSRLNVMYESHSQRGFEARRGHGRHDADRSVIRWCFLLRPSVAFC